MDQRSIRDARRRPFTKDRRIPASLTSGTNFPILVQDRQYSWQDRLSDPFGAKETNGIPNGVTFPLPGVPSITDADDSNVLRYTLERETSGERSLDPATRVALRNIRIVRDTDDPRTAYALVNIYVDHWTGPITESDTWSGDIYVGGDVTIEDGATLTIADDANIHFLAPVGTDASGRSEIQVADGGFMEIGKRVTFRSAREAIDDGTPSPPPPLRAPLPVTRRHENHGVSVEAGGEVIWKLEPASRERTCPEESTQLLGSAGTGIGQRAAICWNQPRVARSR